MRPDICYVLSLEVWLEYCRLEQLNLHGCSVGFHNFCLERIGEAQAAKDSRLEHHWEQVLDFGNRHVCSPLSRVEVEGTYVYDLGAEDDRFQVQEAYCVRVYIDNPDNPQHQHGQCNITVESMAAINRAYQLRRQQRSRDQKAETAQCVAS